MSLCVEIVTEEFLSKGGLREIEDTLSSEGTLSSHEALNYYHVMDLYFFILVVLLLLAAYDLVVGVSNDAANFLNSAVGSRAAGRRTTVIVAAVGVLIGSIFSTGMMEIARSGVFVPAQFNFSEIMMLFLAVMLTDVILLDAFNTFGLPTSTTVSLVFELLGAAVAVALYKMATGGEAVAQNLSLYINSAKALEIVSAIFSSVIVAFSSGLIVMWLTRLLFSFRYKTRFTKIGFIWCGLAFCAITYFAVFKGLKGTTLVSKDTLKSLDAHIWLYTGYAFAGWSIVMFICQHVFKVNILKLTVLAGTMALALAFAGNDLVNFIGVFMAGLNSFEIASAFHASGGDINTLSMADLAKPVQANWQWLVGAGVIMVLALMFSKKARTVTETEVNLARQGGGIERFGSVTPARMCVRYTLMLNDFVSKITPKPVAEFVERRFRHHDDAEPGASFDLLRASVNLMIAALLISLATSMKLPLSTTYVTFMVAMGSSLADKAWGRESAVYRITGVIVVISGWFFTAFAAFCGAFLMGSLLMYAGVAGIIIGLAIVGFLLFKSAMIHRNAHKNEGKATLLSDVSDPENVMDNNTFVSAQVDRLISLYKEMLTALYAQNHQKLKQIQRETKSIDKLMNEKVKFEVIPAMKTLEARYAERGQAYMATMEYAAAVAESIRTMAYEAYHFVDNNHTGIEQHQIDELTHMADTLLNAYPQFVTKLKSGADVTGNTESAYIDEVTPKFEQTLRDDITRTSEDSGNIRAQILFMNLLYETRGIARVIKLLMKSQANLADTLKKD